MKSENHTIAKTKAGTNVVRSADAEVEELTPRLLRTPCVVDWLFPHEEPMFGSLLWFCKPQFNTHYQDNAQDCRICSAMEGRN